MIHPNETILQEIKSKMDKDAHLLDCLPLDLVRMNHLPRDKKASTALPNILNFGHIANGQQGSSNIGVILCIGPLGGPPDQRYKRLDRFGNITDGISASDAARQVTPAAAFKGMKEHGSMDAMKVRALIRYYFIAKYVDLPSTWSVDHIFIKDLTAACRLVKFKQSKQVNAGGLGLPQYIASDHGATAASALAREVQADAQAANSASDKRRTSVQDGTGRDADRPRSSMGSDGHHNSIGFEGRGGVRLSVSGSELPGPRSLLEAFNEALPASPVSMSPVEASMRRPSFGQKLRSPSVQQEQVHNTGVGDRTPATGQAVCIPTLLITHVLIIIIRPPSTMISTSSPPTARSSRPKSPTSLPSLPTVPSKLSWPTRSARSRENCKPYRGMRRC
jgi:hypothetical protein